MKKYLIIAFAGLMTTAVVTATVIGKKPVAKTTTHHCMHHMHCVKTSGVACY